uniref:Sulfotransferase domain-containing protein n=2 Tax=Chrysotila carterae TaxID=13221 RepID=A0A7S4BE37_CHRCT
MTHMKICGALNGIMRIRQGLLPVRWPEGVGGLNSSFGRCLLERDEDLTHSFLDELDSRSPSKDFANALEKQGREAVQCSEMMLAPPSAVLKSATYAAEIERWAKVFPPDQLMVIDTDDLTRRRQQLMNETFNFLGLSAVDVGSQSRFCVKGKAGVMDVLHAEDVNISFSGKTARLQVGDCESDTATMHDERGVMHHNIDPTLQAQLRRFFEPHNQRLYRFLGRDLKW